MGIFDFHLFSQRLVVASVLAGVGTVLLCGCDNRPLNDLYPASQQESNILYTAFAERPNIWNPAAGLQLERIRNSGPNLRAAVSVSLPQTTLHRYSH